MLVHTRLQGADTAAVRRADAIALVWLTVWLVIGVWVGHEIWQLAQLGEVLSRTGEGLDDSGRALQELRDLPVIGDAPGVIGDEVRRTAADVVVQGRQAQASTRRLAVLVGVATALLPALPVLLHVGARRRRDGERRVVRALSGTLDEDELETHLARRALQHVPYERLLRVSRTPERDFEQGRRAELADAELARLGLRRTRG